MTRPVSTVIPALGNTELLAGTLAPLLAELDRRSAGDEVIVVDDTGRGELGAFLAEGFPAVRCLARDANGGFARALTTGIEAARHELVFSLNSDVHVRRGFLEPLLACLEDEGVFAAVPRVLMDGSEEEVESLTRFELKRGMLEVVQPALGKGAGDAGAASRAPVPFAVGGAMLFRRKDFADLGGFDPLFEPFYWEDVDLCWRAWRAGMGVVYQPAAVVEHRHRGTIGTLKPAWVRAAIERNRLLFQWKHLDGAALTAHVTGLYRGLLDAYLGDRRDELVWLVMALEERSRALAARAKLPAPVAGFEALRAKSSGG